MKRGARELFIATLIKVSAPAHALLVALFLSLSLRHLLKGCRICYINVKKIVTFTCYVCRSFYSLSGIILA